MARWSSDQLEIGGLLVRVAPVALRCVLDSCLVLVQPRKTRIDMTEILLTGT